MTFIVNCGEGPFLLSKTNGNRERFVNISNDGACSIRLFARTASGTEVADSGVRIPPGTRLMSYISPEGANRVDFTCSGGCSGLCRVTLTISD